MNAALSRMDTGGGSSFAPPWRPAQIGVYETAEESGGDELSPAEG